MRTVARIRGAYGIQSLLNRGIDGRGQTVVLTELAPSAQLLKSQRPLTDLRQDLAAFDHVFELPNASVTVVPTAGISSGGRYRAGLEEVLDAEMVHAMAPAASIRVVPVPSANTSTSSDPPHSVSVDLLRRALQHLGGSHIISISYGIAENCLTGDQIEEIDQLAHRAAARQVTVLAASGDWGVANQRCGYLASGALEPDGPSVVLPAADPLVTAVGGTALPAAGSPRAAEVAWSQPPTTTNSSSWIGTHASGGGFSGYLQRPAYQAAVFEHHSIAAVGLKAPSPGRGVPDVSADADPATSPPIVIVHDGRTLFQDGGGTSASTPLWAGIVALADQYARRPLGFINAAIYRIGQSPEYHQAFHDITSGNNTIQFARDSWHTEHGYDSKPGWDPVTGWGTPNAAVLVKLLARIGRPDDWKAQ